MERFRFASRLFGGDFEHQSSCSNRQYCDDAVPLRTLRLESERPIDEILAIPAPEVVAVADPSAGDDFMCWQQGCEIINYSTRGVADDLTPRLLGDAVSEPPIGDDGPPHRLDRWSKIRLLEQIVQRLHGVRLSPCLTFEPIQAAVLCEQCTAAVLDEAVVTQLP